MSQNLLLKIPLLAVYVLATRVAMNPPRPPPSSSEVAPTKSTRLEFLLQSSCVTYVRESITTLALIEILAICAITFPSHIPTLLQPLTAYLLPSPSARTSIALTPTHVAGSVLAVLGAGVRWLAYRDLGHLFTFEMAIMKDHRLVTSGTYAWVRHPAYMGLLVFVWATALCVTSEGSWVRESGVLNTTLGRVLFFPLPLLSVVMNIAMLKRMHKEDKAMKELAGKEWDRWAENVRYMLVPYVY